LLNSLLREEKKDYQIGCDYHCQRKSLADGATGNLRKIQADSDYAKKVNAFQVAMGYRVYCQKNQVDRR
jgi:hypothetical protein